MTFQVERLTPVYSVKDGDSVIWRKVNSHSSNKPLEWATKREAQAFADLFLVRGAQQDVRVVEVFDA